MDAPPRTESDTHALRARSFATLQARSPGLSRLDDHTVAHVLELSQVRLYTRGVVLAAQGVRPTHVYGVLHGALAERVTSAGVAREVDRREAGEFSGLAALLGQEPLVCEIAAIDHTLVLQIDAVALARLRAAFHPTALRLAAALMPQIVAQLARLERRSMAIARTKNLGMNGAHSSAWHVP